MRRLVLLALALLSAACTPMEWVKPDATPEALAADSAECRRQAWLEARSSSWFYRPFGPMAYRDPAGRLFWAWPDGPAYDPFSDPYLEESHLHQFCMRNKGYELVPAEK